jgi:hypothetical protein
MAGFVCQKGFLGIAETSEVYWDFLLEALRLLRQEKGCDLPSQHRFA